MVVIQQPLSHLSLRGLPDEVQLAIYMFVFGPYNLVARNVNQVVRIHRCWSDCTFENPSVSCLLDESGIGARRLQRRMNILYVCKSMSTIAQEALRKSFTGVFESFVPTEWLTGSFVKYLTNPEHQRLFSDACRINLSVPSRKQSLVDIITYFPSLSLIDMSWPVWKAIKLGHGFQVQLSAASDDPDKLNISAEVGRYLEEHQATLLSRYTMTFYGVAGFALVELAEELEKSEKGHIKLRLRVPVEWSHGNDRKELVGRRGSGWCHTDW